jgi:hypothetical protein
VFGLARIEPGALEGSPELCLFYFATGIPCPGCGLTRSVFHLIRGELDASFRLHPMGIPLAAQSASLWLLWGVARPLVTPRRLAILGLANAAALLAVWLVRMGRGTLPL